MSNFANLFLSSRTVVRVTAKRLIEFTAGLRGAGKEKNFRHVEDIIELENVPLKKPVLNK